MRKNMEMLSTIIGVMFLIFCVQFPLCAAQVTITPESVVASPGDIGVDVGICLDNPEDLVGSIQLDLCEYTVGGEPIDYMECMDCKLTERTPTYNCEILELPYGCCRVIMYRPNPDYSIDNGLCDVVTVVYSIFELSEDYIGTPCIVTIPKNILVGDFEGFPLTAVGLSGEMCFPDADSDGMPDAWDNCPTTPNPDQFDTRPPGGNGCGDACECESDLNRSGSVDGTDTNLYKADYGRNPFHPRPCTNEDPCPGDFDCSKSVDGVDTNLYKQDYGRNQWKNPCPDCSGYTCVYP